MNFMRGIAAIAVVVFHGDMLFGRQLVESGYWLMRGIVEKLGPEATFVCGVALVLVLPVACVVAERKFDLPLRRRIGRWITGRAG
jgi:peptidoglycan/LPS O-acetylase OafA/YrhL